MQVFVICDCLLEVPDVNTTKELHYSQWHSQDSEPKQANEWNMFLPQNIQFQLNLDTILAADYGAWLRLWLFQWQ